MRQAASRLLPCTSFVATLVNAAIIVAFLELPTPARAQVQLVQQSRRVGNGPIYTAPGVYQGTSEGDAQSSYWWRTSHWSNVHAIGVDFDLDAASDANAPLTEATTNLDARFAIGPGGARFWLRAGISLEIDPRPNGLFSNHSTQAAIELGLPGSPSLPGVNNWGGSESLAGLPSDPDGEASFVEWGVLTPGVWAFTAVVNSFTGQTGFPRLSGRATAQGHLVLSDPFEEGPVVVDPPDDVVTCPVCPVTLAVVCWPGNGPFDYRCQVRCDETGSWLDLPFTEGDIGCSGRGSVQGQGTPTVTVTPSSPFLRRLRHYRFIIGNSAGSTTSPEATWNTCLADFNNSADVTVEDLFGFLEAFFSNDSRADFNGSGDRSVQDIFDFLAAFFEGCP